GMAQSDPLNTFQDCEACPVMIELPLGEFLMGAPDDEFRTIAYFTEGKIKFGTQDEPIIPVNEGPQNKVIVDLPIAMGMDEITFDQWMACVEDGGCGGYVPKNSIALNVTPEELERTLTDPQFIHTPSEKYIASIVGTRELLVLDGRYPVIWVSVLDAMAYTQWLNQKLGTDAYRLPTEAEWEYAARAGTTTRFAQGFEPTPEQANISGERTEMDLLRERPDLRTFGVPLPVDELDAANPWGLRHMSGNVMELTSSCYDGDKERLPAWKTTNEWLKMSAGVSCNRVWRGGDFFGGMFQARVAHRRGFEETRRSMFVGFRVVKEIR
ncbi:MAG: formylglycine-generating enzyme family protein, partial [Bacteroidota bacterium]